MQSFTTNFTNFDNQFLQKISKVEYSPPQTSKQFKFNGKHFFVLLLVAVGIWAGFKIFLPPDPDFTVETAKELAKKIYETGKVGESLKDLPLDATLLKKLTEELERILAKDIDYDSCEVYFLLTRQAGYYPVLGYGDAIIGTVFMKKDEPWKVGMTKNGEEGRYSGDKFYNSPKNDVSLTKNKLRYKPIFVGSYKQCLIDLM